MIRSIFGPEVDQTLLEAQSAARRPSFKTIVIGGESRQVRYPFPSPGDWRDQWIYFLMLDRFNNPDRPPAGPWDQRFDFRQGGSFNGVRQQLDYLAALGVRAIWISPVIKNAGADWRWNYHGYGAQDFLAVDERFGSDGTRATAEMELQALVEEAHAQGIYVILDVVLNHAARVFDYIRGNQVVTDFGDPAIMDGPMGSEPSIQWLDATGSPRVDWQDNLPSQEMLSAGDAVWPAELQQAVFFRRRGSKLTDDPGLVGFVRGDFGVMRQFVVEYDASVPGQEAFRAAYGKTPVLGILIRAYQYLIAKYDFDGFRIDTVKYVSPQAVQTFGNAIREYALSIGKHNFFTFGEVYDDEETIAAFVGRNGGSTEGYGIDAALDFPLFFKLPAIVKGYAPVEGVRSVYERRKQAEAELLSTHGEAGRYFVTFLDNHDQKERFKHGQTPDEQVSQALALLFCLQGIPCLYYGTEQGLSGTRDASGNADLGSLESVREALWGKTPIPFDWSHPLFGQIQTLAAVREALPGLRYGRLYFRPVSGNGRDFGHSSGQGGLVAFSRILNEREVLVMANTHHDRPFDGFVLVDRDLNRRQREMAVTYSNLGTTGRGQVQIISDAAFWEDGRLAGRGETAALFVRLAPMEVQILSGD